MRNEVFLRDFIPSMAIPAGFKVDIEDLNYYCSKTYSVDFKLFGGIPYIRYKTLFQGSILEQVWFNQLNSFKIGNMELYCLEKFLLSDDDRNLCEYFEGAQILVESIKLPFKMMHPLHLSSGTALMIG